MRRKRVVLPAPFRPTMPQRSPAPTVKETSRSRGVGPNWTVTAEKLRVVI
jgi:hypothetical protein